MVYVHFQRKKTNKVVVQSLVKVLWLQSTVEESDLIRQSNWWHKAFCLDKWKSISELLLTWI